MLWPSLNGDLLGSFLKGRFSLKNGTYCPLFSHDTTFFKRTCFLIRLKVLPDGLYVFNGQPDIPVPTYLLKRTVEIWMHTKSARATLIFVNIKPNWLSLRSPLGKYDKNIARIESWMKITSKLANKISSKQNKIQIFILTNTSFEYFNHEQIFSVCSAFTRY
jgi:hypothetical protein